MAVCGIVSEYNPFHLGHAWQLEAVREKLGAETGIVCVMSGNFVQRGDFAVFSKHSRAEAAVRCGADLVLELPLPFCLSSAEGFAAGAVALLHSLGCVTHLAFGCEDHDLARLQSLRSALLSPALDAAIPGFLKQGISYAAARQKALEGILGADAALLEKPNNILALEYLKALSRLSAPIEALALPRVGAGHDADCADGYSASALRGLLYKGESITPFVPAAATPVYLAELDAGRGPASPANCERAILARLRSLSAEDWQALPGNAEGLSDRLMKAAKNAVSLDALLAECRTKRYALSRIRRMLLCAYLGLRAEDLSEAPAYVRVLAFNERGRGLLREIVDKCPLPLITKPAAGKNIPAFVRDMAATDLYVLACPDLAQAGGGTEFTQSPRFVR